jgi:hypothetical protein
MTHGLSTFCPQLHVMQLVDFDAHSQVSPQAMPFLAHAAMS